MKIREPTTTLTDYALAILSMALGWRLSVQEWRPPPFDLIVASFFVTSLAAWIGGSYHGFADWLGPRLGRDLRILTRFLIVLASALMVVGVVRVPVRWSDPSAEWFLSGLGLTLVGLAVQRSGRGLHRHLNHNDIFHLIQFAALALFYIGACHILSLQVPETLR